MYRRDFHNRLLIVRPKTSFLVIFYVLSSFSHLFQFIFIPKNSQKYNLNRKSYKKKQVKNRDYLGYFYLSLLFQVGEEHVYRSGLNLTCTCLPFNQRHDFLVRLLFQVFRFQPNPITSFFASWCQFLRVDIFHLRHLIIFERNRLFSFLNRTVFQHQIGLVNRRIVIPVWAMFILPYVLLRLVAILQCFACFLRRIFLVIIRLMLLNLGRLNVSLVLTSIFLVF